MTTKVKDPKDVIESGLSTGKRTQYAGPFPDTVMPQVTSIECAADKPIRPEMPAKGVKTGIPPRPGLQWNMTSHRWVKPNVSVGQVAEKAGVGFTTGAATHTYSGTGPMPIRDDASERTKFHALAHVLDHRFHISKRMDEDDEELQVERDRLSQDIKAHGLEPTAEEQFAEAFGRWLTDPEFADAFTSMVEFMKKELTGVLDLKKEAVQPPVFPGQPLHAQQGKPAGSVLPVSEIRAETSHKRPAIAVPVHQLKRIQLSRDWLPL